MDTFMVIFRILHIASGIVWVGAAFFIVFIIGPTAQSAGPQGGPFVFRMYANTSLPWSIPLAAFITVVSGLALYDRISDHFSADYMKSDSGIVLSIGAVFGILAFGHAMTTITRYSQQLKNLSREILAQDGPPTPEQAQQIGTIVPKAALHGRIVLGMTIIAVIGMSAARYV